MALKRLKFNVGDSKTLKYQLRQAVEPYGPVDITGLIFTFFARAEPGDAAYTIDPVTADHVDDANGRFEFDVEMPADPTDSVYWITRDDGAGKVDTFKPAEGTAIIILAK